MRRARVCLSAVFLALAFGTGSVHAHCDSLDGPVVRDARQALERGDAMPVLKWVEPQSEGEVRGAFRAASAVRAASEDARQLADRYFFETVVRLHRASEGEGFTGLKPAGSVAPCLAAADRALETGSSKRLSKDLAARFDRALGTRFERARTLRARADDSVEAGRAYVAAYVDYVRFVEEADRLLREGASPGHADETAH